MFGILGVPTYRSPLLPIAQLARDSALLHHLSPFAEKPFAETNGELLSAPQGRQTDGSILLPEFRRKFKLEPVDGSVPTFLKLLYLDGGAAFNFLNEIPQRVYQTC